MFSIYFAVSLCFNSFILQSHMQNECFILVNVSMKLAICLVLSHCRIFEKTLPHILIAMYFFRSLNQTEGINLERKLKKPKQNKNCCEFCLRRFESHIKILLLLSLLLFIGFYHHFIILPLPFKLPN